MRIQNMKNKHLAATVAGILSVGAAVSASAVPDQPKQWEKCAGIVKAGKNDCSPTDGSHGCSGMAKKDDAAGDWIWVAEGTCQKISGGEVIGTKAANPSNT
jgi:uncharacterized membrane protein